MKLKNENTKLNTVVPDATETETEPRVLVLDHKLNPHTQNLDAGDTINVFVKRNNLDIAVGTVFPATVTKRIDNVLTVDITGMGVRYMNVYDKSLYTSAPSAKKQNHDKRSARVSVRRA